MSTKSKTIGDEEHGESIAVHMNILLYYTAIILGAVLIPLIIGVAVFKDYSLRQPMLYMALAGIVVLVARTATWKLQKLGVV